MSRLRLLESIRNVLSSRYFTPEQIDKVIPNLGEELIRQPACLAEVVDTWNRLLGRAGTANFLDNKISEDVIPAVAKPPSNCSIDAELKVDMTYILADVEPNLLRVDPSKLVQRYEKVRGLGLTNSIAEEWLLLFNAPQGFFLQDWVHLSKKIYYIEQNVLDMLYDKKERKEMVVHPIVRAAKAVERDFDHIRIRYMFALRSGYKSLSHMYSVQTASNRPGLKELLLSDTRNYLKEFSPFCSDREYKVFSDLIRNHELDEDDADIYEDLAELNALSHSDRRQALRDGSFRRTSHDEE